MEWKILLAVLSIFIGLHAVTSLSNCMLESLEVLLLEVFLSLAALLIVLEFDIY